MMYSTVTCPILSAVMSRDDAVGFGRPINLHLTYSFQNKPPFVPIGKICTTLAHTRLCLYYVNYVLYATAATVCMFCLLKPQNPNVNSRCV